MTAKELSALLSGREYMSEITADEMRQAKSAGLVVVFGYSDDNTEFRGAINDEVGSYDGTTIYLTKTGILERPDCSCAEDCPYFDAARREANAIKAVWHDAVGPCWTFETDISHETFTIMEDGEPFCEGIMFSMEDVKTENGLDCTPLTLEELREMDGENNTFTISTAFIPMRMERYFGKFEQLVRDCDGKLTACSLPLEYYSKTWTAYRHKPEEALRQ